MFVRSLEQISNLSWLFLCYQDVDDFFEREKNFLVEYNAKIKDATAKSDKTTKTHKGISFIECFVPSHELSSKYTKFTYRYICGNSLVIY